jgi:hypothetical protein
VTFFDLGVVRLHVRQLLSDWGNRKLLSPSFGFLLY